MATVKSTTRGKNENGQYTEYTIHGNHVKGICPSGCRVMEDSGISGTNYKDKNPRYQRSEAWKLVERLYILACMGGEGQCLTSPTQTA